MLPPGVRNCINIPYSKMRSEIVCPFPPEKPFHEKFSFSRLVISFGRFRSRLLLAADGVMFGALLFYLMSYYGIGRELGASEKLTFRAI